MKFNLRPLQGVGQINFGMSRDAVRAILTSKFREFHKPADAKIPLDDFTSLDLHVYYDEKFNCNGMEFWPGSSFEVDGRPVLRRPFAEVIAWLRQLDPATIVRSPLVLSHSLGLSLYVPDLSDGDDAPIESAGTFVTWTGT